ncbi:MAG: hypothetical protein KDD64_07050 [Bdellovibrionales bacterium]|nr:hypothetical protein [Bdellovibrionales bacterium]
MSRIHLFAFFLFFWALGAGAQTRANVTEEDFVSPEQERFTVCSQNLANFGSLEDIRSRQRGFSDNDFKDKQEALVKRFLIAKCDAIAVQEVLGGNLEKARAALGILVDQLRSRTNRTYEVLIGPSNDKKSHVGYIIDGRKAQVLSTLSFSRVELPKIAPDEKPRLFARGPFEVQLSIGSRHGLKPKRVILVNFHFKSKVYNSGDPTELEWETYRMEMAEAVRRVVLSRHKRSFEFGDALLLVLGDRNSNFDVASAKLLEGGLTLADFQGSAPCRLNERGVPLCQAKVAKPAVLFSVLLSDPHTKHLSGTFRFRNVYSWLDDILMPVESLPFALVDSGKEGDYSSGVVYSFPEASDHALVYVRLDL